MPVVTVDTMATLRRFYRDRLAEVAGDPTFSAGENAAPGKTTRENVYTYPPGLPVGFAENQRGVLIREVGSPFATVGQIATARFYVSVYGAEPKDADYLSRLLYGFSLDASGKRWHPAPWKVGNLYVKGVRYESKPIPDTDENQRPIGFLIANMRIGLVQ